MFSHMLFDVFCRVKFQACAKAFIRKFRMKGKGWKNIIFTDFSAHIRLKKIRNRRNNIVWVPEDTDPKDMPKKATAGAEKFSGGFMIWGGISRRGLIPKDRPIFIDEFLSGTGEKTVDT